MKNTTKLRQEGDSKKVQNEQLLDLQNKQLLVETIVLAEIIRFFLVRFRWKVLDIQNVKVELEGRMNHHILLGDILNTNKCRSDSL